MFSGGERVILLASSCRRHTGPRRGSVGFAMPSEEKSGVSLVQCGQPAFACMVPVKFTRFGFEKNSRCESKYVIGVVPIVTDGNLKGVLERVASFISSKNVNPIKAAFVEKDATVALISPLITNMFNLSSCNELELKAWLSSIITKKSFRHIVNDVIRKGQYNRFHSITLRNSMWWNALDRASFDSTTLNQLIESVYGIDSFKRDILSTIRIIDILANDMRNVSDAYIYSIMSKLSSDIQKFISPTNKNEICFGILTRFLFRKIHVDEISKRLMADGGQPMRNSVNVVKQLIDELVLSACILEANGSSNH